MEWSVYILRCADNSLYTGVTNDLERRIKQHNAERGGAKYTRMRQPVSLVYTEACADRSSAQIREAALKKLTRAEKEALLG